MNTNSNLNSDDLIYSSDSEKSNNSDYMDLREQIDSESKNIYQFHIENNKLELKHIGKSSHVPEIIIKENFGPESNLSLYNCVFAQEELESYGQDNLFFPLIKLININLNPNPNTTNPNINSDQTKLNQEPQTIITSLAVKINQDLKYNEEIIDWELYFVENNNSDNFIKTCKLDKDINHLNIVEKIIQYSI